MQSKVFSTNKTLNVGGRLVDLTTPKIMGVLNVTPDSFFDGGKFTEESTIIHQTERMLREGATFIDVGGQSTRPGALPVDEAEESRRALGAIRIIRKSFPEALISIDTFRASVASAAVAEGATIINDISGGEGDVKMIETVAALQVPYVLMHMRGDSSNMMQMTRYENLLKEVIDYFHAKVARLHESGVRDIIIDPGFGFAKNADQNLDLLRRLKHFEILGKPILAGLSRKSTIWRTLDISPEESLNGTTVLNTVALLNGASILRVHDVLQAVECVRLISRLQSTAV